MNDAYVLINDIFKTAKNEITLIDNYIDDTVLTLFSKYPNLNYIIITKTTSKQLLKEITNLFLLPLPTKLLKSKLRH
jgi:hypothetical protein